MKKTLLITLLSLGSALSLHASATENWAKHCAKCHGDTGKADTKIAQKMKIMDYSTAEFQAKYTDEELFASTKDGTGKMKGFANKLSDEEIHELVALIRSFAPAE